MKFIIRSLLLSTSIPLKSLRTDVNLEFLSQKKIVIEKVIFSTEYLDFNKVKPLLSKININEENFKNIKTAKFQINDLELKFDENFKIKKDFNIRGDIGTANIRISTNMKLKFNL